MFQTRSSCLSFWRLSLPKFSCRRNTTWISAAAEPATFAALSFRPVCWPPEFPVRYWMFFITGRPLPAFKFMPPKALSWRLGTLSRWYISPSFWIWWVKRLRYCRFGSSALSFPSPISVCSRRVGWHHEWWSVPQVSPIHHSDNRHGIFA